ncbi:MAG: NGG1p interacting factor NIF3 [Piscirickettsiaceae bacterium]|nr:NGG1p interacting factor NIF3 [Piscirickettsiaceae bacterium]
MYKKIFFVPENHKEFVKQAIFCAGGGKYRLYDSCSWEILGIGQFRPLNGSHPYIGMQNHLEQIAEYRIEVVCAEKFIKTVITSLMEAHPYETPAYEVWPIKSLDDF